MTAQFSTYLMFDKDAENAMRFYTSLFENSYVVENKHYQEGEHKGRLIKGVFCLGDKQFICMDSPVRNEFSFTPSMSIFVEFDNQAELDSAFKALSQGGKVLMPLNSYGFSDMFGWLTDRWGVSWQLNLA